MVDERDEDDKKEPKFDSAGEAISYISLEQACLLAIQHARDNTDFYGPRFADMALFWEVVSQEEGEDYYDINLSFRPAGRFTGEPGVEHFIIDKTGAIELRQIQDEPSELAERPKEGPPALLPAAAGLVLVATLVIGVSFAVRGFGGADGAEPAAPAIPPAAGPAPTAVPPATAGKVAPATGPATLPASTAVVQTPPSIATLQGRIAYAYYQGGDRNREIHVVNADGSNLSRLTFDSGEDARPSWSPDGSTIAFDSNRGGRGSRYEIFAMNADGSDPTNLTESVSQEAASDWCPQSGTILFFSNRDGNNEMYAMDVDGRNQTRLTSNSADDQAPDCSPDGSRIAFMTNRDSGNWEIYVMDAVDADGDGNGDNLRRLISSTAFDAYPEWSPDGSSLLFVSDRDGNSEIYVANSDGTDPVRLTSNAAVDSTPVWAPDGGQIAFLSDRDGTNHIYVMDARDADGDGNGDNVHRLTNNPGREEGPAWSFGAPAALNAPTSSTSEAGSNRGRPGPHRIWEQSPSRNAHGPIPTQGALTPCPVVESKMRGAAFKLTKGSFGPPATGGGAREGT